MPSNQKVIHYVIENIPKNFSGTFVDIGSGWGTVCFAVSKAFPNATVLGIEKSIVPYLVSLLFTKKQCRFLYKDFRLELPKADIYYTYLYPQGMRDVAQQITEGPTRLISNTFALPNKKPMSTKILGRFYKTPVYIYSWILEKSRS